MHMHMHAHACTCTHVHAHVQQRACDLSLLTQRAHLLSGKVAKGEYILDYGYPLTPLQALALGLSALSLKLANEGG